MRALLAVALIGLVACGDPTAPKFDPPESPLFGASASGKWEAEQVNVFFGVTFDITEHRPDSITGTWNGFTQCADFLGGASPKCNPRSGLVTAGKREGERITLTMNSGSMPCGYGHLIEVTRSGNTASGTARAESCSGGFVPNTMPVTLAKK